jgi:uncharacterized protein
LQPLAEQGVASAQAALGWMYSRGEGTSLDRGRALKWYQLAAQQDYPEAQYRLGRIFENGEGVSYNHAEAVKWYQLSADQGFAKAETRLCDLYATGWMVDLNPSEAWKLCLHAADQGDAQAQYQLGMMYAKAKPYHKVAWLVDSVQAYFWFNVVDPSNVSSGEPASPAWFRAQLAQQMSPEQIAKANSLYWQWRAAHTEK